MCEEIHWHKILYIKAIFDLWPDEFLLNILVLLLIKRFANDFTLEKNGIKTHSYESLTSLRNAKFISQQLRKTKTLREEDKFE